MSGRSGWAAAADRPARGRAPPPPARSRGTRESRQAAPAWSRRPRAGAWLLSCARRANRRRREHDRVEARPRIHGFSVTSMLTMTSFPRFVHRALNASERRRPECIIEHGSLRVGEIRVFYDVTGEAVQVLAIITKTKAALAFR